ncbi:MAG: serine/threonine-protein kinase [Myxococcota bacterium]
MTGAPPASPDDPLVGVDLDKYKVLRRIGEGGMGLVYEAVHTVIKKRVAIKVLRQDFSSRPEVVERFKQEAISASRIGHANIVDISDFGTTPDGSSYFVMEFLAGEDLANLISREGTLDMRRAVHILKQCCRALGAAHAKGIVHRDMKPENIFLTEGDDGRDFVKIVDFGIAKMSEVDGDGTPGRKLTKTGMIFGTPEYMSPEQAKGAELDHRVDIYAMGVILYECMTGVVPFVGESFMGILTQHMFEEPPPLKEANPAVRISPELEVVCTKALSKDPDKRFQTMDDLAVALEEAAMGRVSEKTLMGFGEPVKASGKAARRAAPSPADELGFEEDSSGKAPLIAAGALLLLLLGAGGTFLIAKSQGGGGEEVADAGVAVPETPPPVAEPPPEPEAPTSVPVTVETRPADGATVEVDGDVEGCAPTPCTIDAPVGEPLVLTAKRGRSRGELEITPGTATTVQIVLVPQRSRNPGMRVPPGMGMESGMQTSGDLKLPPIFQ